MKNPAAVALGKLGAKASPRSDAWREMPEEELSAIGRKGAYARWAKLSEAERKAQMERVRAKRKPKA